MCDSFSNQVKDEKPEPKEPEVDNQQSMEVDEPEATDAPKSPEEKMDVDIPEPSEDETDDGKFAKPADDTKEEEGGAADTETAKAAAESADEKVAAESVTPAEPVEPEVKAEPSAADEKKLEKSLADAASTAVKKETLGASNSAMESVDKLKAMFPELEVMHKGTDLDSSGTGFVSDKPSKALQLEKTFAQLIAQSYQHPIKWPKVSRMCFLIHAIDFDRGGELART